MIEQAEQIVAGITEGMDGFEDLARILALLTRHRGRALRSSDVVQARLTIAQACAQFEGLKKPDHYNHARALVDMATTYIDEGDVSAAVPYLDDAIALLSDQAAPAHLAFAQQLREACLNQGA